MEEWNIRDIITDHVKSKAMVFLLMTSMVYFTFECIIDIQNFLLQVDRISPKCLQNFPKVTSNVNE